MERVRKHSSIVKSLRGRWESSSKSERSIISWLVTQPGCRAVIKKNRWTHEELSLLISLLTSAIIEGRRNTRWKYEINYDLAIFEDSTNLRNHVSRIEKWKELLADVANLSTATEDRVELVFFSMQIRTRKVSQTLSRSLNVTLSSKALEYLLRFRKPEPGSRSTRTPAPAARIASSASAGNPRRASNAYANWSPPLRPWVYYEIINL